MLCFRSRPQGSAFFTSSCSLHEPADGTEIISSSPRNFSSYKQNAGWIFEARRSATIPQLRNFYCFFFFSLIRLRKIVFVFFDILLYSDSPPLHNSYQKKVNWPVFLVQLWNQPRRLPVRKCSWTNYSQNRSISETESFLYFADKKSIRRTNLIHVHLLIQLESDSAIFLVSFQKTRCIEMVLGRDVAGFLNHGIWRISFSR